MIKKIVLIISLLLIFCLCSNSFSIPLRSDLYAKECPKWIKYSAYTLTGVLMLSGASLIVDRNGGIEQAYCGVVAIGFGMICLVNIGFW